MNQNPFASSAIKFSAFADWLPYTERALAKNAFATLLLLVAGFVARRLLQSVLSRQSLPVESRRRFGVTLRNGLALIVIAGLVVIWARELQTLALSLFAIAVAFVIATKELWQCLTGSFVRAGSSVLAVGHRIEVKGLRGDVIDHNLFHTTILEVGPGSSSHQYTGRTILLPNSLFLENPVVSDNYTGRYIVQIIPVPLAKGEDWVRAESLLLKIANQECAGYLADARKALASLQSRDWIEAPSADPRVTIKLRDPNEVTLLLRVPAPARRQRAIEQRILQRFLRVFYAEAVPAPMNGVDVPAGLATQPAATDARRLSDFPQPVFYTPTPTIITQP